MKNGYRERLSDFPKFTLKTAEQGDLLFNQQMVQLLVVPRCVWFTVSETHRLTSNPRGRWWAVLNRHTDKQVGNYCIVTVYL